MNETEFRRTLERFPVVRKKTFARVEWNALVRLSLFSYAFGSRRALVRRF